MFARKREATARPAVFRTGGEIVASIEWSRLSSDTYERMVACLLSHQNPAVRRIDGSGGDGGRDCQFEAADGLHAYEMKGFPGGRVGRTQQRQVERSLKRSKTLNPVDWTLITPVDPTPEEWEWFKRLRKTVSFPIEWRGLTWLDLEFAQRTFIADYYIGTTKEKVYDLLRDIHQEQAALANGVPDAVVRVNRLVNHANALDPHYRFRIESDGMVSKVTILPAYLGAEVDRPITVEAQFRFDTTTEEGRAKEEEFRRALDFGVPAELPGAFVPQVTVDAPAGLGGTYASPEVSLGPGAPVTTEPLDLVFSVVDPVGATVAALELECVPQSTGRRGSVLIGTDRGSYVTVNVTIDATERKFHINLKARWDRFVPHEFAPVAKFLNAYREPNFVIVAQPDGGGASEPFPCGPGLDMPDGVVEFVRNLAIIQASASLTREVSTFDVQDLANAAGGVALIRGAAVPVPLGEAQVTVLGTASQGTRQQLGTAPVRLDRVIDAPFELSVAGTVYPLGRRQHRTAVLRVDPRDLPRLLADDFHADLRVRLIPDPEHPSELVRLAD